VLVRLVKFIFLFSLASPAVADELHLVLSGTAIHIGTDSLNENNEGVGFEYDFNTDGNWIPFITGATFKDSNDQTSKYLGAGRKHRFLLSSDPDGLHIDAGIIGFVMTRYDYKENEPFFAALPFVSIGNDWIAANITYAPKIDPKMHAFWYVQANIKLFEF